VTMAGQELVVSASDDATVRIWDPATGTQLKLLEGHGAAVRGVCSVTVDGQELLASASDDWTLRIWEPATGTRQRLLKGHQGWVNAVCSMTVAGQGLVASASTDWTVRIWDPATGQPQALMRVERPLLACARIDSHGLAVGGEGGLYGFDIVACAHPER